MDKPWRVISNADGVDESFATLPEALKSAEEVVDLWRQQACDEEEWDEDVEGVEIHLVTHAARITRRDGDDEDDGVEYGMTEMLNNEIDEDLMRLRVENSDLTAALAAANEENLQLTAGLAEFTIMQQCVKEVNEENGRLREALERIEAADEDVGLAQIHDWAVAAFAAKAVRP